MTPNAVLKQSWKLSCTLKIKPYAPSWKFFACTPFPWKNLSPRETSMTNARPHTWPSQKASNYVFRCTCSQFWPPRAQVLIKMITAHVGGEHRIDIDRGAAKTHFTVGNYRSINANVWTISLIVSIFRFMRCGCWNFCEPIAGCSDLRNTSNVWIVARLRAAHAQLPSC